MKRSDIIGCIICGIIAAALFTWGFDRSEEQPREAQSIEAQR